MPIAEANRTCPIAIGGVGGSGTRIPATYLEKCGFYIGGELSGPKDNLWYALLFGRRDVLLDTNLELEALFELFCRQMSRAQELTQSEKELIQRITLQIRCQHEPELLQNWAGSFIAHTSGSHAARAWGWKVPYTHIMINRFLAHHPELKYVHVTRNPLDMAFSKNQNQLKTWGSIYLNRDIEVGPRDALSYWCAVHKRMMKIGQRHPGRIHLLDYDKLVHNPETELSKLSHFIGNSLPTQEFETFCQCIRPPQSIGRHKLQDLSVFEHDDLKYIEAIGYDTPQTPTQTNSLAAPGNTSAKKDLETRINETKKLKPGDPNYRAFVGPPTQYDFMGATQFALLYSLGLREEHKVVDIGCGSLRAGRLLMQFLLPHRYIGIEPNNWLWKQALAQEVGKNIIELKKPTFSDLDDFSLGDIEDESADFVVAQSIYSHTCIELFRQSVAAAKRVLKPKGQFLFTALNATEQPHAQPARLADGWIYPNCVNFEGGQIEDVCSRNGLLVQKLDWYHPRQVWYHAVCNKDMLLTADMKSNMGQGRPLFDPRFATRNEIKPHQTSPKAFQQA